VIVPALLQEASPVKDGDSKIRYTFPMANFNAHVAGLRALKNDLWQLDSTWDLGGYTVGEFKRFWLTLLSRSMLHSLICFHSGAEGGALNSLVTYMTRRRWVNELGRLSGLPTSAVGSIIDDLIFDISLQAPGTGKKPPNVTCQPFFPLRDDLLAVSNHLVMLSNPERNVWDLVAIRKPGIHSRLRNKKEKLQQEGLVPRLKDYGLAVSPGKEHPDGNIDLLVIDRTDNFALNIELKWLTAPDGIKEVAYTGAQLQRGIDQARTVRKWLETTPPELSQLTGLSTDELDKIEFQSMVVSRNTTGGGRVFDPEIPVVNERLVDWVLGDPLHRSLRTLWIVGKELRYLPKRGKHFRESDIPIDYEGFRFLMINAGMEWTGPYDPAVDIDLEGIEEVLN